MCTLTKNHKSKNELENEYDSHLRQLRKSYDELVSGKISQEEFENKMKGTINRITDIGAIMARMNDNERMILKTSKDFMSVILHQVIDDKIDEIVINALENDNDGLIDNLNIIGCIKIGLALIEEKL